MFVLKKFRENKLEAEMDELYAENPEKRLGETKQL